MSRKRHDSPAKLFTLGSLESEVLAIVCEGGGGSVGEVRNKLSRDFAYTTVMTTLDRLYKKDLLERRKAGRRFLYAPKIFRRAEEDDLASQTPARRLPILTLSPFVSYLLDAVGSYDEMLLQELEKKIAIRRHQFEHTETT
jgi:predicted transcriptional regulator